MQRWCPEPLVATRPAAAAAFASDGERAPARGFRPEAGFADHRALLAQLSREERRQVLELVDQDLRAEYDARLAAELARREEAAAGAREVERVALAACQESLAAGVAAALDEQARQLATATVTLAVQLAEKLVRARVAVDDEVLVRAVETILFKAEPGVQLLVTCHPDDAALLADDPDLRARLRIAEVKHDRRIERGGCLVRAGDLEWDATIGRQLGVLEEVARAALAGATVPQEAGHDGAALD